jgi:hypothetical protein
MKNKIGRPIMDNEAKEKLVGARFGAMEAAQVSLNAQKAGVTKSEWIRQQLLGQNYQTPRADLRRLWSPARILSSDGQELAKGLIKLRTVPDRGVFVPDQIPCPSLGIPRGKKLVAEIGIHRFDLAEWEACGATVEVASEGTCHLGPHYHFDCPLQ